LLTVMPSFLPSFSASSPHRQKFHHKPRGETTRFSSRTYLHRYTYRQRHFPKPHALPVTPNSPRYNGHRAGNSVHASAHEQRGSPPPRTFNRVTCFSPAVGLANQSLHRLLFSPHLRLTRASRRRQLQSCTCVLPALLLDDTIQALLFDLPSSRSAAPVAQRTLVRACKHTKARPKTSTAKYLTQRALHGHFDVMNFHPVYFCTFLPFLTPTLF